MLIYSNGDFPIFVDPTGKNDLFPSLYSAVVFEPLINFLTLNEGV